MYDADAQWIVVLEAAVGVDDSSLHRMLQILSSAEAVALHCADRYAIQMEITAGGQAQALFVALTRWRSAHRAVDQPLTEVVRAEVLSREEFERDCRLAYGDGAVSAAETTEGAERRLRAVN